MFLSGKSRKSGRLGHVSIFFFRQQASVILLMEGIETDIPYITAHFGKGVYTGFVDISF